MISWSAVFLVLMATGMYANPVLLCIAWFRRMRAPSVPGPRGRLGWLSLALASIALLAFGAFVIFGPQVATPEFDLWYARWFHIAAAISACTLLTGLAGKGKMQWAVPLSAVLTPISVMLQKILE